MKNGGSAKGGGSKKSVKPHGMSPSVSGDAKTAHKYAQGSVGEAKPYGVDKSGKKSSC